VVFFVSPSLRSIAEEMTGPLEEFSSKLEALAVWFDAFDTARGIEGQSGVQDDLRRWDRELREALRSEQVRP
jgi:hypothetical protein